MFSRIRTWFALRRSTKPADALPAAANPSSDSADGASAAQTAQLQAELRGLRQLDERLRDYPHGAPGVGLRRGERLLISVADVALLEQRVAYRRGPRVNTEVDRGDVWVTTRSVRFLGGRKKVEWRFDSMLEAMPDGSLGLLIRVANHRNASGLAARPVDRFRLASAVDWGRRLHAGVAVADVRRQVQAAIDDTAREITRLGILG